MAVGRRVTDVIKIDNNTLEVTEEIVYRISRDHLIRDQIDTQDETVRLDKKTQLINSYISTLDGIT